MSVLTITKENVVEMMPKLWALLQEKEKISVASADESDLHFNFEEAGEHVTMQELHDFLVKITEEENG